MKKISLLSIILAVSCTKQDPETAHGGGMGMVRVNSLFASKIYADQFTANAEIVSGFEKVVEHGFYYSVVPMHKENPENSIDGFGNPLPSTKVVAPLVVPLKENPAFTAELSDLIAEIDYYYMAYAKDGNGKYYYGDQKVVRTAEEPALEIEPAGTLSWGNAIQVTMKVVNQGGLYPRNFGAYIWKAADSNNEPSRPENAYLVVLPGAPQILVNNGDDTPLLFESLTPMTGYYIQPFAQNSREPKFMEPILVSTASLTPPSATTGTADAVGMNFFRIANSSYTTGNFYPEPEVGIYWSLSGDFSDAAHADGRSVCPMDSINVALPSDFTFTTMAKPNTTYYIRAFVNTEYTDLDGNRHGYEVLALSGIDLTTELPQAVLATEWAGNYRDPNLTEEDEAYINIPNPLYGYSFDPNDEEGFLHTFTITNQDDAALNARFSINIRATGVENWDLGFNEYGFFYSTDSTALKGDPYTDNPPEATKIISTSYDSDELIFTGVIPDIEPGQLIYYRAYAELVDESDAVISGSLGYGEVCCIIAPIYGGRQLQYAPTGRVEDGRPNPALIDNPNGIALYYYPLKPLVTPNGTYSLLDRNLGGTETMARYVDNPTVFNAGTINLHATNSQPYTYRMIGHYYKWGYKYPQMAPIVAGTAMHGVGTTIPFAPTPGWEWDTSIYSTATEWPVGQNPCPYGSHIPLLTEWNDIFTTVGGNGTISGTSISTSTPIYSQQFLLIHGTKDPATTSSNNLASGQYWAGDRRTGGYTGDLSTGGHNRFAVFNNNGAAGSGALGNATTAWAIPVRCVVVH